MTDLNLYKTTFKYGLALAAVLMHFKTFEYFFFSYKISLDLYLGIIVFSFLLMGTWMGLHFHREEQSNSKVVPDAQPQVKISPNGDLLSEYEKAVLQYIAQGHSNGEIAKKLFVSVSTVKMHINNIYLKLNVEQRTQAVSKAKALDIIRM